ncbi:MAG: UpxY family transcription antiterminator [Candidatus Solibacter usitatus]|nr:UpxY family transcription antiterminator [Candidatus Solibacter usitatus]
MNDWYALRVKSKHEKAVAESLRGKGYEAFVPMYASRRAWSDRVKVVELPLFSGYVFCRLDIGARLPVLKTPGVVSFVSLGAQPTPIEAQEMEAIQEIVRAGLRVGPWPYLREGQRVEVTQGALKGFKGILLAVKNERRLVVSIDLLQRSVAVEVGREDLRPVL